MGYLRLTHNGVTLAEIQVVREQPPANVINAANPSQLTSAINAAQAGWTIQLAPGHYGNYNAPTVTRAITIKGAPNFGSVFSNIDARVTNATWDGVDINGGGQQRAGWYVPAANVTLKNSRIHNIMNEKGSYCAGPFATFDNCDVYDILCNNSAVHNEGIYTLAPNVTIRNCRFENCATMDVFVTRGTWYNQPYYGGVTIEGNHFGVSRMPDGSPHYYGFVINGGSVIPELVNWRISGNHFEQSVAGENTPSTGSVFCGNTGECPASWKVTCA